MQSQSNCSLAINSLYQGKIQGISRFWSGCSNGKWFYRFVFRIFAALWSSIQPLKNRELKTTYQGIAFPDTRPKLAIHGGKIRFRSLGGIHIGKRDI